MGSNISLISAYRLKWMTPKDLGVTAWCPRTFKPPTFGLYPLLLGPTHPPHCSLIHKPPPTHPPTPGDAGPWPLKRSALSGCWQMHRNYFCNKYFLNYNPGQNIWNKLEKCNNIGQEKKIYCQSQISWRETGALSPPKF